MQNLKNENITHEKQIEILKKYFYDKEQDAYIIKNMLFTKDLIFKGVETNNNIEFYNCYIFDNIKINGLTNFNKIEIDNVAGESLWYQDPLNNNILNVKTASIELTKVKEEHIRTKYDISELVGIINNQTRKEKEQNDLLFYFYNHDYKSHIFNCLKLDKKIIFQNVVVIRSLKILDIEQGGDASFIFMKVRCDQTFKTAHLKTNKLNYNGEAMSLCLDDYCLALECSKIKHVKFIDNKRIEWEYGENGTH